MRKRCCWQHPYHSLFVNSEKKRKHRNKTGREHCWCEPCISLSHVATTANDQQTEQKESKTNPPRKRAARSLVRTRAAFRLNTKRNNDKIAKGINTSFNKATIYSGTFTANKFGNRLMTVTNADAKLRHLWLRET